MSHADADPPANCPGCRGKTLNGCPRCTGFHSFDYPAQFTENERVTLVHDTVWATTFALKLHEWGEAKAEDATHAAIDAAKIAIGRFQPHFRLRSNF